MMTHQITYQQARFRIESQYCLYNILLNLNTMMTHQLTYQQARLTRCYRI